MSRLTYVAAVALCWSAEASAIFAGNGHVAYPATRRVDQIDEYHGTKVPDPYRWLEADVRQSPEVAAWVAAQNRVTADYLDAIPERGPIRQRLTELWDYERYSAPRKAGGRYAFVKNDGLQNQSVLYIAETPEGQARALLDPNRWSRDGTVTLAGSDFSGDGTYVAYGVSEAGSDWQTWRVMEVSSGRLLDDELKWIKFGHAAWTKGNEGFYYARYGEPRAEERFQGLNLNQEVYYHRVGTPQTDDAPVYRRPDHPEWSFGVHATEDGRYLIITAWKGDDNRYRILYKDLAGPEGEPVELIDRFEAQYSFVANDGPVFYFLTNRDAPRRRLIAVDIVDPERGSWKEVIPEAEETLIDASLVDDRFVAIYLKDASTRVKVFTMAGTFVRDLALPAIGTASGFGGRRGDTETFYSFASFATPPTIYRYDMATGRSTPLRRPKVGFEPGDYQVEQVFYTSKDGTRVPMFVSHKKGVRRDGSNPTLLYGYGGYGFSLSPWFSVSGLAWMEMGGIYAVPNLRGGGEYGEQWHLAGAGLKKQNTFDDFIAAADWLIRSGYTRPAKLAIEGGSAGGLLVGAVMTQRPDLFGACLPEVGVHDMLRFHRFTDGRFWASETGTSDDSEEFRALRAYSPYHNVKDGTGYPATLVTTADTDDRVVPLHSFKFAAALQHAQAGPAPVLLRVDERSGHGADKPTPKRIAEVADQFAFLVESLGMTLAPRRHAAGEPSRDGEASGGGSTRRAKPFPSDSGPKKADNPASAARKSLEGFDAIVEQAIHDWKVPGLAIAVVKNGQVVCTKGFGKRDLEGDLPVTPKTLFAIGSCTKAFTTFVMGTLVDEGKLDWDQPVRTYLPGFRMFDPVATEQLTPRDLVAHRSGLARHDLVWYGADLSRRELVERLPHLEPAGPIRAKFRYNNIMYIIAGHLVERITGTTWEDAVRSRVFEPLGMSGSNLSVLDSQKALDFATPYAERDGRVGPMPFRDISNGGPSGSINSSAEDMARWVAVHAGRGKSGGKALISPPVLADIHAPRMTGEGPADHPGIIPVGYGLGWSVDAYRGHRRVRHGGNIDGFTAETCILPDDGLGIVVLCNMYSSPLPDLLVRHLTDRLLELDPVDWSGEALKKRKSGEDAERVAKANKDSLRRPGTSPAHAFDEYAGDYYDPGYGTLSIEHRDGRLVMTHNRREAPLEHWHFEVFNALAQSGEPAFEDMKVQFSTNVKGYVDAVSVPFEPSLKPIVFSRRPDKRLMNPEYLKRFTGDYELAGRTFAVKLQGDALLVGIEGAPSLELLADRDDGFEVKGMIGFRIRFLSDEGGRVKEAAFSQPEGVYMMKRK